jgi:hypothetical protein
MPKRDYSQDGDPYHITEEYTSQSADVEVISKKSSPKNSSTVDVRGNSLIVARPIPTQAEADAIVRQA